MIFKKKQWNSDLGLASEVISLSAVDTRVGNQLTGTSKDIFGVLTLTNCLISSCSTLYYSST